MQTQLRQDQLGRNDAVKAIVIIREMGVAEIKRAVADAEGVGGNRHPDGMVQIGGGLDNDGGVRSPEDGDQNNWLYDIVLHRCQFE